MSQSIRDMIDATRIIDVHEHHIPDILLSRDVNLLQLFRESYAGWTVRRGYALPSESQPEPIPAERTSWEALAPILEKSGSNGFVRNLVRAVTELHGQGESTITRNNWEGLDEAVRERHAEQGWWKKVIEQAQVERLITDPYTDPLLDSRTTLGTNYDSVLRINAFACGWHQESRDHNGNSALELLARLGLQPKSFDDYMTLLDDLVAGCPQRHQVALKNALAYDRDLAFDEPDELLAREAWGKLSPTVAERKAFGDFVVDRFCRAAGECDLPVQMHLGSAIIRGSNPLMAAGLIERHPRTRFLLMHLAYPWSRDLLGMAFVYRNIWLDLTWSWLLSPSHFKLALHEAIEVLPDESRMMIGGDNWHVEETYGAMKLARRLIGEVLADKISDGYFGQADAERLARKMLRENAMHFFGLDVHH